MFSFCKQYQQALRLNESLISRIERLEKEVKFLSENRSALVDELTFEKYRLRVAEGDLYLVKDKVDFWHGITPQNKVLSRYNEVKE